MEETRLNELREDLEERMRKTPRPIHEDEEGVLSILYAATNDLALLVNTLDLQATPNTPDMTPLRPSPLSAEKVAGTLEYDGSPQKEDIHRQSFQEDFVIWHEYHQLSSPFAQSCVKSNVSKPPMSTIIGQQIALWPTRLSPLKEAPSSAVSKTTSLPSSTFRPGRKRTSTPAPEPEPELIFRPLHAATVRTVSGTLAEKRADNNVRALSSLTFGSRSCPLLAKRGRFWGCLARWAVPMFP